MKNKLLFLLLFALHLYGQTIEEKCDSFHLEKGEKELRTFLDDLNIELRRLRAQIDEKYDLVNEYYREEAKEGEYQELLKEVKQIRRGDSREGKGVAQPIGDRIKERRRGVCFLGPG